MLIGLVLVENVFEHLFTGVDGISDQMWLGDGADILFEFNLFLLFFVFGVALINILEPLDVEGRGAFHILYGD